MRKSKVDTEIKKIFEKKPFFTREELYEFYQKYEPDLNQRTFGWRIFDLKKKNIIRSINRGVYKISDRENYNPSIDPKIKKINAFIIKNFFEPEYVIWTTRWLNDLSLHISFKNFYIVEVPNDQKEMVFEKLNESGIAESYISPDESIMQKYVIDKKEPIVVKTLVTRSPVKRINKIRVPVLEKLLVDIYCDSNIFYMYQGHELKEIFRNAIQRYIINWSKLLNYAKRRNRGDDIKEYLVTNFANIIGEILNDKG